MKNQEQSIESQAAQRHVSVPTSSSPTPSAARYRLRQFLRAIIGHPSLVERVLMVRLLAPGELRLFERMPHFDQRHCLDVYHTLTRAGYADPLLLRAALIHDCGKVADDGRTIPLFYYGVFVVLQRFAPDLYQHAAADGGGLLWPFRVHANHERRSAVLAEMVGSPPELVAILQDYAARRPTMLANALAWADEQN